MNRVKKAIATVLIFIFLYNVSGYYFAFNIQKTRNRASVENIFEENNENDFVIIKFSLDIEKKIEWESSTEFRMNGKMYDVAFKKQHGNILYFYCYRDVKEDHLFASLNSHVKNNLDNTANDRSAKNKLKISSIDFYNDLSENKISLFNSLFKGNNSDEFSLADFFGEFPSPPPRSV